MRSLRLTMAVIAGLVLVLTYFLAQGMTIDTPRRERADALQAIVLYNAALQRDVLLARAGLLPSYDPLVVSMENLSAAVDALRQAPEAASGEQRADFERRIGAITQAVRGQEALVEDFKSRNALLRNSLSYLTHLSGRLANERQRQQSRSEIGALTAAMLRFLNAPGSDAAEDVEALLDRHENLAGESPDGDIRSLVSHARLVVSVLPDVDARVAGIQAAPTRELARTLQNVYLEADARAAAQADIFMMLLYSAALGLIGYVAVLFVRLRANARILSARLEFERLIAAISSRFINLPRDRIRGAVADALGQLAAHSKVAAARIIPFRGAEADPSAGFSSHGGRIGKPVPLERMLELIRHWPMEGYERHECLQITDTEALLDGNEKAWLGAAGIRSILCIPMRVAGECLGVLVLHDSVARRWDEDDIALLRTAAEIFANAISRERSEKERDELQAHLNRSQRLEAIGTLAGGIAHEFNNILGAIRGYGEMALAALRGDTRARGHVQHIMQAGERAHDIIEQVLAFGRRRVRECRRVAVETTVTEAVSLLRASLPNTLSLRTELSAGGASLVGDATELQQVVLNLGTNAAQAMDGHGSLTIGLTSARSERTLDLSHGRLPPGTYVRLTVRDTGPGIDDQVMERMFEPFFTTKPAGNGTGLGLSTVHGIVTAHRGAIDVKSQQGKGSIFAVYFPQADEIVREEPASGAPMHLGRGETVLIVDDDGPLLLLGEDMLAALGYEPVGFEGTSAALAAFRSDPARFDLVLTDEVLPEMTGTELARAIHELRPDIPIVLMTGYDRAPKPDQLQAAGVREILRKPLLSGQLSDCLARQLRRGGGGQERQPAAAPGCTLHP